MAVGTEVAATGSATHPGVWVGTIKPFIAAHPVGVAIVGTVVVIAGTYYLTKAFSKKKPAEESPATP